MRYNPEQWFSFKKNAKFTPQKNVFHVKLAEPGALSMIDAEGEVKLIGYGHDFKVVGPNEDFELTANQNGVCFQEISAKTECTGPVLTNMDKQPLSAAESQVTLALRNLKRRERIAMQRIADANAEFIKKRSEKGLDDDTITEETDSTDVEETVEEVTEEAAE